MYHQSEKFIYAIIIIIIIVIFFVFFTSFNSKSEHTFTNKITKYTSSLTRENEVPPVKTNGIGNGILKLVTKDGSSSLFYEIVAKKLSSKLAMFPGHAHIHSGKMGVNGPVVKTLVKSKLCKGVHTFIGNWNSNDLEQPLTNDLIDKLNNNELYINIHTENYPSGEIRGQIYT
uniref:CHRD chordin domain protein n=1 Tax=Pithovirus LCPAC001 TaxID=2506585 RepID=A0A481Z1A8_9VIRU|nr:MAG: CHRD chordin domain protein [Pithovirus LCPAC001]